MNQNLIELEHITKSYDGDVILDDLNLSVKPNSFVTLLGPSGCGKTTTLRIIGGFETPDKGRVIFDGQDITNLPPNKRQLNTVFQKYALFPHMSISENIAFGLKIKNKPKAYIDDKIKYALKLVNLTGFENRTVDSLSGGQQQRIAIARAIVNQPKVLLLDEPLAALDLKMRKDMQTELKEMHKKLGITFIYVTHDQEEALTLSDTIVVLNEGRIQQIGTPVDIYNEPVNSFVADFIGESNILNGTMIRDRRVSFIGHDFDCVDEGFGENVPVDVVVRPEDIYFTTEESKTQFTAKVKSCTFKGVHYEMFVDTDTGNELMIQDYDAYPVDSTVRLYIDPDDIQVMKKERTCNTLYGTVKDEETVSLLGADFPLKSGFEAGTEVKVEVPFEAVDLLDNLDDGVLDGEVHFILYKGDHYHLTIKTDAGDFLWVDTNDIWDKGDLVGIRFIADKGIKISRKDG